MKIKFPSENLKIWQMFKWYYKILGTKCANIEYSGQIATLCANSDDTDPPFF